MALTSITRDFVVKAGALVEGTSFVTSSTGQTSTLQVNGGAAIAKNLIVGTTATIWGATTLQGPLVVNGYSQLGLLTATTFTATTANIIGNAQVGGLFTATGATYLGSSLTVNGNSQFNGALNTFSGALFVTGTNIFTVGTGASNFGGTVTIAGVTSVTNTSTANSAGGTGALVVSGGTLINDNLVVKSTAYNTATNTANAIYTAGAVYADKGLTVAGPVLFKDIVTFNGTATYVLSTNTFYTDNILEIHTPPTGVYGDWFVDDGKDIGFRFHYFTNGTDTNAALVLDNASKELHWYRSGAEAVNGDFSSSTFGTFRTGNIFLTTTTNATSTITGALQVAGGAGIGLAVYAGGNISGGTLTGRNLTTASGLLLSDANGNIVNSPVTYNYATGRMVGTADLSNTATNITGGASGSLPYQTGAGATTMLPIGTNGQILTVSGGNPAWAPVSGLTAGLATTATNIAGGLADNIPYQTAPGQTAFNVGLRFNGTTFTATNIVASGNSNSTGFNNNTGALQVKGGAAVNNDLWVGGDIHLNGSLFLKGVGLDQITGSTGTFDFLIVEGTGTSLTVSDGSIFGGVTTVSNFTSVSSTNTGALQVRGGVGINGGLFVGGIVTATTFVGASTQVNTIAQTTSSNHYITFVDTNNATSSAEAVYTTSSFYVNPATGNLNVGGTITVGNGAASITSTGDLTLTATGGNVTTTNVVIINNATGVSSTATGALRVVNGGVGIGGGLFVGGTVTATNFVGTTATISGNLNVTSTTPSLGVAAAGSIQTLGGVGIAKDIYVGTTATVAGTFFATSTNPALNGTGVAAIEVTGGVEIAKDIYVGTTATVVGITFHNNTTPTLASATQGAVQTTGGVGIAKDLYVGTTATIAGSASITGALNVTGQTTLTTASITTATIGNLVVTGTASLPGSINLTALTVTNLTVTNNETVGNNLSVGNLFTATGASVFGSTISVAGIASFNSTQDSNATNNGAIVTLGGVGIAKNLTVGTAVTVGTATTQTTVNAYYSNNFLLSSYTSGFIVSNSQINLDTFSSTAYRTCKYVIQIVDGTKIHVEEILLFHDGTNVYMTEYGIATSQGELGEFDATLATGTVTLKFTANYTPTSMTIKTVRQAITL